MKITDLLKIESVILNEHSQSKEEDLKKMVHNHFQCGHINNEEQFFNEIIKREELVSTDIKENVSLPHAKSDCVNEFSVVAMVDQSLSRLFFMFAIPKNNDNQYLEALEQLNKILINDEVVQLLIASSTSQEFMNILAKYVDLDIQTQNNICDVVAVTACPSGVIHTYMVAKSLENTAKKMGIKIKVEMHGTKEINHQLTKEDIDQAKCVIIVSDQKIDTKRFSHKPIIYASISKGIHEAQSLLEEAMQKSVSVKKEEKVQKEVIIQKNEDVQEDEIKEENKKNYFLSLFLDPLYTAIQKAVPILMIYGIFQSLTDLFNLDEISTLTTGIDLINRGMYIGQLSIYIACIVISAFIADKIGGHLGFCIAAICAMFYIFYNVSEKIIFIIILGFIAGFLVKGLKKIFSYLPKYLDSIISNVLIPVIAIIIMIIIILKIPMSSSTYNYGYEVSQGINIPIYALIIIGIILGGMMSVCGYIQQIAYIIGVCYLVINENRLMSAVMIAGMIPSIIIGLSMLLSPDLFAIEERNKKWQCIIRGLCFDNKESNYFIKKYKKSIQIPCIIASALAGGLSIYFGCQQMFPHGGIFVLPLMKQPILFMIAFLAAILLGTALILIFKKNDYEKA